MKFKVIKIGTVFTVISLLTLTIITGITISHIGVTVNQSLRKLPIYSVDTKEKKIAITFDAAWSASDTYELIEILKTHNAKATIFAVGDWVDKNPDAVKKFHKNGHEMANHSNTHAAFSKISREQIKKEITDCNKKIENITGVSPKLVRAPSGDYDNKSIEVSESLNMKMIQWDCDSLDWKKLSVEEMYNRVINNVQNGSIILFHNGVENTPKALDKILTKLEKDGYEFVTVSDLIYWDNYEIDHSGRQQKLNT